MRYFIPNLDQGGITILAMNEKNNDYQWGELN